MPFNKHDESLLGGDPKRTNNPRSGYAKPFHGTDGAQSGNPKRDSEESAARGSVSKNFNQADGIVVGGKQDNS